MFKILFFLSRVSEQLPALITASVFCTFNMFCLQEKGQKVAKICLTWSQFTVKFSQKSYRPLFTFTLNVNEQFWKFPKGRIAPGFRPFDKRKFSSCLVNRGLWSPEGCRNWRWGTLKSCDFTRSWWTFFSVDEGGESCWHLLKLVERRLFTVAFNAPVTFVPCDSLNLTCLNVFCRQNSHCRCSQWMVCQVRLDSCSFCHLPQQIFQGVVPEFAFAFIPDVFFCRVKLGGAEFFRFLE